MKHSQLFALVLLLVPCFCVHADDSILTVTARGTGITESDARKNALVNAMQQAVGSFMDTETLVENDQLIHDQVLSVSDGFVRKSDLIGSSKKNNEGLYEVSIRAEVERGKVQERLKSISFVRGSVTGKDAAAEVITKIANADQGMQLLEKYLDGLMEKLLVARLVDKSGKASQEIRPITEIQADRSIKCTWNIEVYFNQKAFYEQIVPQLDNVLRTISTEKPTSILCSGERSLNYSPHPINYPCLKLKEWQGLTKPVEQDKSNVRVLMSVGRDRFGENERFKCYSLVRNLYEKVLQDMQDDSSKTELHLYAMDDSNGLVREEIISLRSLGLSTKENANNLYRCRAEFLSYLNKSDLILSPRFGAIGQSIDEMPIRLNIKFTREHFVITDRAKFYTDTVLIPHSIVIEQSDLERITSVRFQFGRP